jgi:hypothetical protein
VQVLLLDDLLGETFLRFVEIEHLGETLLRAFVRGVTGLAAGCHRGASSS